MSTRARKQRTNSTLPPAEGSFAAVQKLRAAYKESQTDQKLPRGVRIVTEKDVEVLHKEIHSLARKLMKEISKGNPPQLELPLRGSGNIVWDEDNDLLLLGEKTTLRSLGSLRTAKDVTRLIRVLEIVHELLEKDIHATKRNLLQ